MPPSALLPTRRAQASGEGNVIVAMPLLPRARMGGMSVAPTFAVQRVGDLPGAVKTLAALAPAVAKDSGVEAALLLALED